MLNTLRNPTAELGIVTPLRHRIVSSSSRSGTDRGYLWSVPLCALALLLTCKVHAQVPETAPVTAAKDAVAPQCLPDGSGFLRARLKGAIDSELDWGNENTECTGAVRPTDGGIRMRFTRQVNPKGERLVLVFGIAKLAEGLPAKALPVNVTVIREGAGEFYGTQGDDKCTLDEVTQTPIVGIPHRARSYRVVARGFCTEPARAIQGTGSVLISRFDYAGRVDFEAEDIGTDAPEKTLEARRK